MKHPLEFDGECSNPKHWMFTGGDCRHKAVCLLIAFAMWAAGWVIGGAVWVMAMIDRRKHGILHHHNSEGGRL